MLKLGCNEIVLRIYSEHINLLGESHEIISVSSRRKYIADSDNESSLLLLHSRIKRLLSSQVPHPTAVTS
jgi:hypothetical protein